MLQRSIIPPLCLSLLLATLPWVELAAEGAGEQAIVERLETYAASLDRQDTRVAADALHEESRQFALTPKGLLAIDKPTYLALMEQKKIGGVASQASVRDLRISGTAASAVLERRVEDRGVLFTHHVHLLWLDPSWKVMSVTTSMVPIPQ